MQNYLSLFVIVAVLPSCLGIGVEKMFPEQKQFVYFLKSNISVGTLLPVESSSHWTLEAKLHIQVYNFTRLRLQLKDVKTSLFNTNEDLRYTSHAPQMLPDEAAALKDLWDVYYHDSGIIYSVNLPPSEPVWSANIKRAIAITLQLQAPSEMPDMCFSASEPCLHDSCVVEYSSSDGKVVRKTHAVPTSARGYGRTIWLSVMTDSCSGSDLRRPFIGNAERLYRLGDKGLQGVELTSSLQYHSHNHLLSVATELTLNLDMTTLLEIETKVVLNAAYPAYHTHGYREPTNARRPISQADLVKQTKDILSKISDHIDYDNVVKDAEQIHKLDLIRLHKIMSQLDYQGLMLTYIDLMGTSYTIETNKNIFMEVLPHVKSGDSALFVKYLVINQKVDDTTALSLMRKLPFNVANYSQELLLNLDDFLKLGPDFAADIRHAAILSFSNLAYSTYINGGCSSETFESYVQRYFSMYTECPQYADRMVWLQGLANLQLGNVRAYLSPIIKNSAANRHERFLAAIAALSTAPYDPSLASKEFWPILTSENDHIQLRIMALRILLKAEPTPARVLALHNYVSSSKNSHLQKFWFTTVRSYEKSTYSCYHPLAKLTSYVSKLVKSPDERFWATGNYIVDTADGDRDSAAMLHLWTIAEPYTGLPAVVHFTLNSNQAGLVTNNLGVMIKAEGVAASFLDKMYAFNAESVQIDKLLELLRKMKVQTVRPEAVHVEVLVQFQGKTVYATHLNQSRFDSWTGNDMMITIQQFLETGSHVNQQFIQYPLQMDVNLPTELGTPVSLETIVSSFSSIRGNLTSASTAVELTRKNDIHLRYHGTAVTTLSSAGPLLGSDHAVRIQQSLIAHLPIKLDVVLLMKKQAFQLNWLNEDPTGGVAMHSRAQVSLDMGWGRTLREFCPICQDAYTVRTRGAKYQNDESGLFFDCDRPMTGVELVEKLLDSNKANYDFFTTLRPSLIVVHGLFLLSVPPADSCGVVLASHYPFHLPADVTMSARFELMQMDVKIEENIVVKIQHGLLIRENKRGGAVLLNVTGESLVESGAQRVRTAVRLSGHQPGATDPTVRHWKLCIEEKDLKRGTPDQDITSYPSAFEGNLTVAFGPGNTPGVCPMGASAFKMNYRAVPTIKLGTDELSRYFEMQLIGQKLPKLDLLSEAGLGSYTRLGQIIQRFNTEPLNVSAIIQEKSGVADVSVNSGARWQFKTENLDWLLDSWSSMQLLRKFGIYRECRIQDSTVHTLSGAIEPLPALQCSEGLALADCSDKPRFALLRLRGGGFKFYTGGNYVTVSPPSAGVAEVSVNGVPVDYRNGYTYPQNEKFYDFKISPAGEYVKVHSRLSGAHVYCARARAVLLVPDTFAAVGCGACASQHYYNVCP